MQATWKPRGRTLQAEGLTGRKALRGNMPGLSEEKSSKGLSGWGWDGGSQRRSCRR